MPDARYWVVDKTRERLAAQGRQRAGADSDLLNVFETPVPATLDHVVHELRLLNRKLDVLIEQGRKKD